MYEPAPFGLRPREAVAEDYRGASSGQPDRVVLTASTSEAYSFLYRALPRRSGDEILMPRPSYPLIAHLARLDAVVARDYELEYQGTWSIN